MGAWNACADDEIVTSHNTQTAKLVIFLQNVCDKVSPADYVRLKDGLDSSGCRQAMEESALLQGMRVKKGDVSQQNMFDQSSCPSQDFVNENARKEQYASQYLGFVEYIAARTKGSLRFCFLWHQKQRLC